MDLVDLVLTLLGSQIGLLADPDLTYGDLYALKKMCILAKDSYIGLLLLSWMFYNLAKLL